ncbi:hypothetical protein DMUE_2290 [Dictyocoela muelleri]|nr:hypothetical protein DMUE_2290 [Dictyocoela muelleri]
MKEAKIIPRSTALIMFLSVEDALEYLVDEELLPLEMKCPCCFTNMELKIDKAFLFGAGYRCPVSKCRKRSVVYKNKFINKPAISIHKKILAIYEFINDYYQKRIANDFNITKSMVQNLKKVINSYIEQKISLKKIIMLGGENKV